MKRPDGLDRYVGPVSIQALSTSYFSQPEDELDPETVFWNNNQGLGS
jgi:hypothetical protein